VGIPALCPPSVYRLSPPAGSSVGVCENWQRVFPDLYGFTRGKIQLESKIVTKKKRRKGKKKSIGHQQLTVGYTC